MSSIQSETLVTNFVEFGCVLEGILGGEGWAMLGMFLKQLMDEDAPEQYVWVEEEVAQRITGLTGEERKTIAQNSMINTIMRFSRVMSQLEQTFGITAEDLRAGGVTAEDLLGEDLGIAEPLGLNDRSS